MVQLILAMKKDALEYIRKHINIMFGALLFFMASGLLVVTLYMPTILGLLMGRSPEMFQNIDSMNDMMSDMFPCRLDGSLGVLSANIAAFYSIVVIFTVQNLIPEEIKTGKWIIPLGAGYQRKNLLISKLIVYGIGSSIPAIMIYNAYYLVASYFLDGYYKVSSMVVCSLLVGFSICMVTLITILNSVIFKNYIVGSISLIMVILLTPDILGMFSFGKLFPTYLLTYITKSMDYSIDIVIPIMECALIVVIMYMIAVKKIKSIEVNR